MDLPKNLQPQTENESWLHHQAKDAKPMWRAPIRDNIVHSPYPAIDVPRVPIPTAMRDALQRVSQQAVMVQGDTVITAVQLLEKIEACAAIFISHGLKQGDRIWCKLVNGIESFAALFGAIFAGAVVVLVGDELRADEALRLSSNDMAEYFLTDATHAEKFKGSRQNFKKCFVMGGDIPGFHSITDSHAPYGETFKGVDYSGSLEDRPAALCFSSGTTTAPKATMITHYTFVSAITSLVSSSLLQRGDRCVILASITHAFGFYFITHAVCTGATIVITPPIPKHEDLFDIIEEKQVQVICSFPSGLSEIFRHLEETGRQVTSVRKVLCTGGPIPREVGEGILRRLNLTDFKNFLGCTEGLSSYCVPPPGEKYFECVGFPSPNVKIKVIDLDSGRAVGPGENGEIWVQSPSVTPGYVCHDGQLQRVVDENGWLHTGDLGYYNEDGRFFVVERLKSLIKCYDYRVYPHELEAILATHPAVIEVCVVGIPKEPVGEAPTAFVVRRKNDDGQCLVTEEELINLVASRTVYYKHLHGGVVFLDELPKTRNGKVNVRQLRLWKPSAHNVETA